MSARELAALDRGVIDAGLVAAEAAARVARLEATVAELARRVELATSAAGILRQAGDVTPVADGPHHPRRRHLSAVPPAGGTR